MACWSGWRLWLVFLATALSACAGPAGSEHLAVPPPPAPAGPYSAATGFYRDPNSPSARWVQDHRLDPRSGLIDKRIAQVPAAYWIAGEPGTISGKIDGYVRAARANGQLPLLVAYNVPIRDCGQNNAGGVENAEAYGRWIREFADAIGSRPAVVILEPDALLQFSCLSPWDQAERLRALNDATQVLAQRAPKTWTYLDGGDGRWADLGEIAPRLIAAGVAHTRGFAVNISNYNYFEDAVGYGSRLRARLNDNGIPTHFVVDNSRSGKGPANDWCNPPGRALGPLPAFGGPDGVDSAPWVKGPGETDGDCGLGRGHGSAGFVPEIAMQLIRNSN